MPPHCWGKSFNRVRRRKAGVSTSTRKLSDQNKSNKKRRKHMILVMIENWAAWFFRMLHMKTSSLCSRLFSRESDKPVVNDHSNSHFIFRSWSMVLVLKWKVCFFPIYISVWILSEVNHGKIPVLICYRCTMSNQPSVVASVGFLSSSPSHFFLLFLSAVPWDKSSWSGPLEHWYVPPQLPNQRRCWNQWGE